MPRPALRTFLASALLFLGTGLAFLPVLSHGFVNYDDPSYVTDNPHVQAGLTWAGVVWAFTAPADYWHPLTWLSHMLDWQLYGAAAWGHHLTSVLWHALNGMLVLLVFHRLTRRFWLAVVAAALFAVHPLRVESVAWITERKDVLSGACFLLTLLAYTTYAERRRTGRPWAWSGLLTLACFAGGLMSKPMLVTVPVLLLLLDFWPLGRVTLRRDVAPLVIEKLPLFLMSAVAAAVTVRMQQQVGAFVLDLPFGARAANAVVSLARYLGKLIWPTDLVVCYPHPGTWPVAVVVGATLLVAGISWLAWVQRRQRPWLAAGWLWYLVTLLPVIGLVQVGYQAMADRYTYLPLLGIELAVLGSLAPWLHTTGRRRAAATGAGVVVLALSMLTLRQQRVWRDSVSLFTHAVTVTEGNAVAEDFLASALLAAGRRDEAASHAERACALDPRRWTALVTLAGIREQQGRPGEAVNLYQQAAALRPREVAIQMQLGLAELAQGHTDEARRVMTAALRAAPDLRGRTLELGQRSLERREVAAAQFFFELILAVWPDYAEAHAGTGAALFAANDLTQALTHLRAATTRNPGLAAAQLMLARCAERLGQREEATTALERALAAGRDDALLHYGAAELYARRNDLPTAIRLCRRAVELAPQHAPSHAALGYLLLQSGDRAAGLAEWRRALELNPADRALRDEFARQSAMGGPP